MRSVDFDAIVAETQPGEPIEVKSGKHKFHVCSEMPWSFVVAWDEGRVDDALASLVPPKELDGFRTMVFADNPSRATALKRLTAIWDSEPGESKASSRSSANGSTRSRPTSRRTTK